MGWAATLCSLVRVAFIINLKILVLNANIPTLLDRTFDLWWDPWKLLVSQSFSPYEVVLGYTQFVREKNTKRFPKGQSVDDG